MRDVTAVLGKIEVVNFDVDDFVAPVTAGLRTDLEMLIEKFAHLKV